MLLDFILLRWVHTSFLLIVSTDVHCVAMNGARCSRRHDDSTACNVRTIRQPTVIMPSHIHATLHGQTRYISDRYLRRVFWSNQGPMTDRSPLVVGRLRSAYIAPGWVLRYATVHGKACIGLGCPNTAPSICSGNGQIPSPPTSGEDV